MHVNSCSPVLIKTDKTLDYIPVLSTFANLIDIFQKCVLLPLLSKNAIEKNHYYKHLSHKDFSRCMTLLVPILGNILIGILDAKKHIQGKIPHAVSLPYNEKIKQKRSPIQQAIPEVVIPLDPIPLINDSQKIKNKKTLVLEEPKIIAPPQVLPPQEFPKEPEKPIPQPPPLKIALIDLEEPVQILAKDREQQKEINKKDLPPIDKDIEEKRVRNSVLADIWAGIPIYEINNGFKNDKEIFDAAFGQNALGIRFANKDLKKKQEYFAAAVLKPLITEYQNFYAKAIHIKPYHKDEVNNVQPIEQDLLNDKNIEREKVLASVKHNPLQLKNVPEKFKNDKEIVLTAVQQNSLALEFASDELKDDKDIVLVAVKKLGTALKWASNNLQNRREIVLEAILQDGTALEYASEELKKDKHFILAAQKKIVFPPPQFQVVRRENNLPKHINPSLFINPYIPPLEYYLKNLPSENFLEIKQEKKPSAELNTLEAHELVVALKKIIEIKDKLDLKDKIFNDKNIMLPAVKHKGSFLKFASKVLQNDKEVVLAAVEQDGLALQYASENFRRNKEVVLSAVRQNKAAVDYANEDLKNDEDIVKVLNEKD